MNALSILQVQFDDLDDRDVSEENDEDGPHVRTPPDFGILTTVIRLPYARCVSTFSFSWPTTSITFTAYTNECSSQRAEGVDLLRKASTHARISVCRWSADVLEGDDAKLDGVSTMMPEARPTRSS
jgi:hypothetical protein